MSKYREQAPKRLSIEISDEQYFEMQRLIPHSLKTPLFRAIVDDVIEMLEDEDSYAVIGAILRYKITLSQNKRTNEDGTLKDVNHRST